jgi:hemin uptake protein HemP
MLPANRKTRSKPRNSQSANSGLASQATIQVVNSRDLLDGRRMLVIQHGSDEYRLHLTQGGKLILTK